MARTRPTGPFCGVAKLLFTKPRRGLASTPQKRSFWENPPFFTRFPRTFWAVFVLPSPRRQPPVTSQKKSRFCCWSLKSARFHPIKLQVFSKKSSARRFLFILPQINKPAPSDPPQGLRISGLLLKTLVLERGIIENSVFGGNLPPVDQREGGRSLPVVEFG